MSITFEQVSRSVGAEVHIHPTSLTLQSGSLNVLLGPTLAGKTTLMRLLGGLDRPTSGSVLIDGEDVTGRSVRKRDIAMVYQQFINYPSFTVRDNIASPLRRAGVPRAEVNERVEAMARSLHIDPYLDRLPSELSGGQQQRTALARALIKRASLLLLDEPLVNLDYKLREELREELRSIFSSSEAIVVYATTEPLEALMLGGNVIVLDEGQVLQQGPTLDVYHAPATQRVSALMSDPPMNMIDGEVKDGVAEIGTGVRLPLAAYARGLSDGRYRFGVRSNYLSVHRERDDDIELKGEVELAEISGSETFVHFAHGGVSWVAQDRGVHSFKLGEPVSVFVNPAAVFAFATDGRLIASPKLSATGESARG